MNKFAGHNFARAIVLDLGLGPNFGMHKWAIVKQPMGRPLPRPSHADEDQALSLSLSLSLFSLSLSLCLSSLSLSLSLLSSLAHLSSTDAQLPRNWTGWRCAASKPARSATKLHAMVVCPSSPKRRGGKQDWSRSILGSSQISDKKKN